MATAALSLFLLVAPVLAQSPAVPSRQIPAAALAALEILENRFVLALAEDCSTDRCFAKGCTYVDHAVIDRPRASSLPGLGMDAGPGSVPPQEFLTRAQCAFAYDESTDSADAQALVRRLQARLSQSWTVVTVQAQAVQSLPAYLHEPPAPVDVPSDVPAEPPEEVAVEPVVPEPWSGAIAGRELWLSLLPHFFWMIGVLLVTLASMAMIWAWRRVGRDSLEDQALLAQLSQGTAPSASSPAEGEGAAAVVAVSEAEASEDDPDEVARQAAAWTLRLEAMDPAHPDPEVQALIHDRLRAGDLPLLAKAVLRFPRHFPAAFPSGGEIASAKLALADFLQTTSADALPSDAVFFAALSRHALAAALATQSDARIVRSLREDFGAAGLAQLIGALPARTGALLFALTPAAEQHEVVLLLREHEVVGLAAALLRSNRMDPAASADLLAVLEAAREGRPLPPQHREGAGEEVPDRGAAFDAAGALSVLLATVAPEQRAALFAGVLQQHNGALPGWHREIITADLLSALSAEARADLLLEVDADGLAAWLSLLPARQRAALVADMPAALRASLSGAAGFASRAQQLARAAQGRDALARGFQRQLARANLSFAQIVAEHT